MCASAQNTHLVELLQDAIAESCAFKRRDAFSRLRQLAVLLINKLPKHKFSVSHSLQLNMINTFNNIIFVRTPSAGSGKHTLTCPQT